MLLGRKPLGTVCYMGGVPAVLEDFCWSWGQLIAYNSEFIETDKEYIHYNRVKFSDHGPARNKLASEIYGDWILMLDTDHIFDPDTLSRILKLHKNSGVEVISGLYRFKSSPYSPVAYIRDEDNSKAILSIDDDLDLLEISAAGAGCLWFTRNVYNILVEKYKCGPFDRFSNMSEDHSFFKRCAESNIKCYLAPKIEAQHLMIIPVTKEYGSKEINKMNSILKEVRGYNG